MNEYHQQTKSSTLWSQDQLMECSLLGRTYRFLLPVLMQGGYMLIATVLSEEITPHPPPHAHMDSNKKRCQILPLCCHLRRTFRLKINNIERIGWSTNLQPTVCWHLLAIIFSGNRTWETVLYATGDRLGSILREEVYRESWQPSRLCSTRLKRKLQNSSYAFSPWHFLWLSL